MFDGKSGRNSGKFLKTVILVKFILEVLVQGNVNGALLTHEYISHIAKQQRFLPIILLSINLHSLKNKLNTHKNQSFWVL